MGGRVSDQPSTPSEQPEPRALGDAAPGPVSQADRINSIDILRGFALLGILVINVYFFALPFMSVDNPLLGGGRAALHVFTWQFTHIFFSLKFMSLFSLLFGAGVILFTGRLEAAGKKSGRLYYRRIFWLLLIGLVHAYFIWVGDILVSYALVGLLVYPLRKLRGRPLIIAGMLVMLVWFPLSYGGGKFLGYLQNQATEAQEAQRAGEALSSEQVMWLDIWSQISEGMYPSEETLNREIEAYRGAYSDALSYRIPQAISMQIGGLLFFVGWRVLGMMLLGMGLYKLGVLSALRPRRFYLLCMIVGYGIGLPVVGYGSNQLIAHSFDAIYIATGGGYFNYVGSILVMFGHLGLVMFAYQSGWVQGLMKRLAAVGRTALSNYLLQSVVFTLLFYGYGLELYAKIDRFYLMGFVIVMWVAQLYVSPWWLSHFRFGPVEWLWRSLTYKRKQPMRARPQVDAAPA